MNEMGSKIRPALPSLPMKIRITISLLGSLSLPRWSRLCRSTNIELIDLCPEIRSDAQVSTDGVEGPSFGHLGRLTPGGHFKYHI